MSKFEARKTRFTDHVKLWDKLKVAPSASSKELVLDKLRGFTRPQIVNNLMNVGLH
jgi:hypothetical protein